jgi:hypothetical protein
MGKSFDVKSELQKRLDSRFIDDIQNEINSSGLDWLIRPSCGELRMRGDVIFLELNFVLTGYDPEPE